MSLRTSVFIRAAMITCGLISACSSRVELSTTQEQTQIEPRPDSERPDSEAPVISAFAIPATSSSLSVPVTIVTATDNVGVTGYLLTESPSTPAISAAGWTVSAPANYTFATEGLRTLFAWAKDAAGNISASASGSVTITLPSLGPTVTLKGTPYRLREHPRVWFDGPTGPLTSSLVSKAVNGNVPWDAMLANVQSWFATQAGTRIGDNANGTFEKYKLTANRGQFEDGELALQAALICYAGSGGDRTNACSMLDWLLIHIESYVPIGACDESRIYCGVSQEMADVGSRWMTTWSNAYSLGRSRLTALQQRTFADKILNDISIWGGIGGLNGATLGAGCTNNTVIPAGFYIHVPTAKNIEIYPAGLLDSANGPVKVGTWITSYNDGVNGVFVRVLAVGSATTATTDSNLFATHASGINYGNSGGNYSGAINISGSTVTAVSGITFTSAMANNAAVIIAGTPYRITAFTNSTTVTVQGNPGDGNAIAAKIGWKLAYKPEAWTDASCGALWTIKHHVYSNWIITGRMNDTAATFQSQYPSEEAFPGLANRGGQSTTSAGEWAHNLVYTKAWGFLLPFLALIDDDNNASNRSQLQLTKLYDYWQDYIWDFAKKHWSGLTQSGSYYQMARAFQMVPQTAIAVTNSLATAPPVDLVGGNWFKRSLAVFATGYHPDKPNEIMRWGQDSVASNQLTPFNVAGLFLGLHLYDGTPEAAAANYWLRNLWSNQFTVTSQGWTAANMGANNCMVCSRAFVFTNPDHAATAPSQTAYFFGAGDSGEGTNALWSRTNFTGFNSLDTEKGATLTGFFAHWIGNIDHIGLGNPGSYKIYKRGYLLSEDYGTGIVGSGNGGYTGYNDHSNYVEIGGVNNLLSPSITTPQAPIILRSSVTNPNYAYAMADLAGAYKAAASVSTAHRHFIHLKKPNTQDFVVAYDFVATSAGKQKKIYLHYNNNGQAGEGTTSLAGDVVTSHQAGNVSQLLTKILAPTQVYINNDGAYAGGNGQTHRISVCASLDSSSCDSTNSTAEFLTIHMPVDGTGNSLPIIQLIANPPVGWQGVEILGSSPKAVIISKDGTLKAGVTFTSTHPGTAQYVIAGLLPGTHAITAPSSPGSCTVAANDNTCYFESTAGVISVTP